MITRKELNCRSMPREESDERLERSSEDAGSARAAVEHGGAIDAAEPAAAVESLIGPGGPTNHVLLTAE
jgi:hypothetical protein